MEKPTYTRPEVKKTYPPQPQVSTFEEFNRGLMPKKRKGLKDMMVKK